jgi:hypothetical protein
MKKVIIIILIVAAIILIPWQSFGITEQLTVDGLKNYENNLLKDALKVKNKRIIELEEELSQYNILYAELQINYEDKVIESEIRKLGSQVVYIQDSRIKRKGYIQGWFKQRTEWTFNGNYQTVALFDNSKIEISGGVIYAPQVQVQPPSLMNKQDCFVVDKSFWAKDLHWREAMLIQIEAEMDVLEDVEGITAIVMADLQEQYPEYIIKEK